MKFVPDDWILTEKLRDYARKKNLTEETIDDQEEAFRLHQFKVAILDFDRAWMRWIRSAIEWGKVTPVVKHEYRTIQDELPEERKAAILAFDKDMKRFGK